LAPYQFRQILGRWSEFFCPIDHLQGGTIMGKSPENPVVNSVSQHWQVPNLFVLDGSTFPHIFLCTADVNHPCSNSDIRGPEAALQST
jgi:choline dehydrogenase-like flavoprotein